MVSLQYISFVGIGCKWSLHLYNYPSQEESKRRKFQWNKIEIQPNWKLYSLATNAQCRPLEMSNEDMEHYIDQLLFGSRLLIAKYLRCVALMDGGSFIWIRACWGGGGGCMKPWLYWPPGGIPWNWGFDVGYGFTFAIIYWFWLSIGTP